MELRQLFKAVSDAIFGADALENDVSAKYSEFLEKARYSVAPEDIEQQNPGPMPTGAVATGPDGKVSMVWENKDGTRIMMDAAAIIKAQEASSEGSFQKIQDMANTGTYDPVQGAQASAMMQVSALMAQDLTRLAFAQSGHLAEAQNLPAYREALQNGQYPSPNVDQIPEPASATSLRNMGSPAIIVPASGKPYMLGNEGPIDYGQPGGFYNSVKAFTEADLAERYADFAARADSLTDDEKISMQEADSGLADFARLRVAQETPGFSVGQRDVEAGIMTVTPEAMSEMYKSYTQNPDAVMPTPASDFAVIGEPAQPQRAPGN